MANNQSYHMHQFDSIGKFVDAAVKNGREGEASHASADRHGNNWAGTASFDEAVSHARYGTWKPENMQHFTTMFDTLEPKLRKFVADEMERGRDTGGFEVNMDAYVNGEPEDMFQWMPTESVVQKRALCVIIGHSISAHCSSEDLFIRGRACVALVRALQLLGYELEIWSEETVGAGWDSSSKKMFTTLVRLHGAGEIMDESAVEFAVGNPSWLRRLLFGFQEGQTDAIRKQYGFKPGGGYGQPSGIHHAELVGADVQLDLGRTWFANTPQKGMEWVVTQLKELGVIDQDAEIDWDEG